MNNDVQNLYDTIKILIKGNALDVEFEECIENISEDPNTEITVTELNDYLRESISYWEE
jgi:hypothetical protein